MYQSFDFCENHNFDLHVGAQVTPFSSIMYIHEHEDIAAFQKPT